MRSPASRPRWGAVTTTAPLLLGLAVGLISLLAPGVVVGQIIDVDYFGHADWAAYDTWAWQEGAPARDPEGERMIRDSIEKALAKKGWKKVEEESDILVKSDVLRTYSQMIGALRIDVVDVRSGELAWRALATGVRTPDRKKNLKQLGKVLKSVLKQFPAAGR